MARALLLRRSQLQAHLKILTSSTSSTIPRADLASHFFSSATSSSSSQLRKYLAEDLPTVSNWSGNQEVQTLVFRQPETLEELEKMVKEVHQSKTQIRPVGSGLSPNGIGLSRMGMVNLALMDRVLEVEEKKT